MMIDQRMKILTPRKFLLCACAMFFAWLGALALCSLVGSAGLSWFIFTELRLPRLLAASLVGAGLSAGGIALQSILRNPLAEPYLLGISSGAGVGVITSIAIGAGALAGVSSALVGSGFAFAGAFITSLLVYKLATSTGRLDRLGLILAGVIINSINGALMLLLHLYLDQGQIVNFAAWMMGSVREDGFSANLIFAAILILLSWSWLIFRSAQYNLLGLGSSVAQSAGVAVNRLRVETFFCVAIAAAASVSLAGPIGFVGLIVPHVVRVFWKYDCRIQLVAAGFAGAIFMLFAHTICYALLPDVLRAGKVPVGIVTALAGGPFFLLLLKKSQDKRYA